MDEGQEGQGCFKAMLMLPVLVFAVFCLIMSISSAPFDEGSVSDGMELVWLVAGGMCLLFALGIARSGGE